MGRSRGKTPSRFGNWLRHRANDAVLVWLFRGLLAATALVLVFDLAQFREPPPVPSTAPDTAAASAGNGARSDLTVPAPFARARRGFDKRWPRRPGSQLAATMSFHLHGDGRLWAVGTIEPGTAETFAAEVHKHGSSVKTVVLHSPGGSIGEAMAMGRLIRQKKFATEVADGRYCASSCPLVFAGGTNRRVGAKAAIAVHQVIALAREGDAPLDSMDSVQRVSAECQKYLREMGIDPLVWVHAMETPTQKLFYFKAQELLNLRLATHRIGRRPPARDDAPARS